MSGISMKPGTYDITLADLAELLDISTGTIERWLTAQVIGQPHLVEGHGEYFNLSLLWDDLSASTLRSKDKYLPLVEDEIEARNKKTKEDEERLQDEIKKTSDHLRDVLHGLEQNAIAQTPFNRLLDGWHAWMEKHRPRISVAPEPVEGSTCPCRICGDDIPGVPTTTAHDVLVDLPHEHTAEVRVSARSTMKSTGAFCGKCMTFAAMTIFLHDDSWAAQEFWAPVVIPNLGGEA